MSKQYIKKFSWMPISMLKAQTPLHHTLKRSYVTPASKNVYITTPIFYVNSGPHIGHLYSAVLADTIKRYNEMLGHVTFLSTGTDEHGNKVRKAAKNKKIPVFDYCTEISSQFQEMCDKFDIDYCRFIRTTEERHRDAVYHLWNILEQKGFIYLDKYSGWYCASDEMFLSESEIIRTEDTTGNVTWLSKESNNLVEWIEEDTYKFKLSALEDDLTYWLKNENSVRPENFRMLLLQSIKEGPLLQDLSISRPISRVPWGIPTPSDASHTIYVWLDALSNYLTSIGYPDESYKKFWPPSIQIVGKDILKFHAVYWPAFLIAAGLEPPKTVLCHSHWLTDSTKMSKSKGNVITPNAAAEKFTESGLRYFLLRHSVLHSDTNYSEVKITNILNAELAGTFGNLISRCTNETINPSKEIPPIYEYRNVLQSDVAIKHFEYLQDIRTVAQSHYEEYNLHDLVDSVMNVIRSANKLVDYHQPWALIKKDDPEALREHKALISIVLETVRISALILHPIIPRLTSEVLDFLKVPHQNRLWKDVELKSDSSVNKKRYEEKIILFKRIQENA